MTEIRLTDAARQDLIELWQYYSVVEEASADRILARIDIRIRSLADHPKVGRARPEFELPDLRSIAVRPHVIFYSCSNDEKVFVHRIGDGRRDLPSVLKPGND